MMGDLHNIDDLFKAGLEGKEEAPEEKVWNSIEQELDKNSTIAIRKKYLRMRRASAILLILLLGVSIYALRNTFVDSGVKKSGQQQTQPASNDKSSKDKSTSENAGEKASSSSSLPAIDQDINKIDQDKSDANKSGTNDKSKIISTDRNSSAALEGSTTDDKSVPYSSNKNKKDAGITPSVSSSDKNKNTRDDITKVTAGGIIASGNSPGNTGITRGNSKGKNVSVKEKGNTDQNVTDQDRRAGNNKSSGSTVPPGSKGSPGSSSTSGSTASPGSSASLVSIAATGQGVRSAPFVTPAKISADNALTDAVKSSAGNLSIPVKNKKNNQLDLPRFSITPTASLNLMSNAINNDLSHSGSTGHEKNEIERTEQEKLSYTFSLLFDVKVARRITIQTGIGYMEKTTSIDPKQISAVRTADGKIKYQFDCSAGRYYLSPKYGTWPRVGDSAHTIASANELHYITVPLAVKYHFGNNKLNFFALAGADANFLLGQELTTGLYGASYYGKKASPKPIGLNNVFVNAMLGGGINYSVTRWLGLTFSPTYRFSLNPINKDMPFKAYPRNISLAGGVRFSF